MNWWTWLTRLSPFSEPAPVERAEEAAHAKEEAEHRHEAAKEVLAVREHVIVINHIAYDIGRAYAIRGRVK
jgi:hypothetical protein